MSSQDTHQDSKKWSGWRPDDPMAPHWNPEDSQMAMGTVTPVISLLSPDQTVTTPGQWVGVLFKMFIELSSLNFFSFLFQNVKCHRVTLVTSWYVSYFYSFRIFHLRFVSHISRVGWKYCEGHHSGGFTEWPWRYPACLPQPQQVHPHAWSIHSSCTEAADPIGSDNKARILLFPHLTVLFGHPLKFFRCLWM